MSASAWWKLRRTRSAIPVDQILLFCFHYDPATGKYGAVVMNMVRFAGRSVHADRAALSVDLSSAAISARTGTR